MRSGCPATRAIYLTSAWGLSFTDPRRRREEAAYDEYLSDPAKPVPYVPRPARFADRDAGGDGWSRTSDFVGRPDVLTYVTPSLTEPVRISGAPVVTWGINERYRRDWVVKLIDVYPDEVPSQPEIGGYQLGMAMDIFRGRYRESFETPQPIRPILH